MSIDILCTVWFKGEQFAPRGKHSPRLTAYLYRMKKWAFDRRVERLYGRGVIS